MSKSETQHHQSIVVATDQSAEPDLRAHDITMSAVGRAIRDLVGIDTREGQALPPTFEELGQIQRLAYEDTARVCAMEVMA